MDIENGERTGSAGHHAKVPQPFSGEDVCMANRFDARIDYQRKRAMESVLGRHEVDAAVTSSKSQAELHQVEISGAIEERSVAKNSPVQAFYFELKRRGVVQAATSYMVVSWVIAQVAELICEIFSAPEWTLQALLIALAIGLPIALIVAWAFEMTADGLQRDHDISPAEPNSRQQSRGLMIAIVALLVLVVSALLVNREAPMCSGAPQARAADPVLPIKSKRELYFPEFSTKLNGMSSRVIT